MAAQLPPLFAVNLHIVYSVQATCEGPLTLPDLTILCGSSENLTCQAALNLFVHILLTRLVVLYC